MSRSYSSASTFQICKKQFYHRYVARDVRQPDTTAIDYGNRVHKAFEDRLDKGMQLPDDLHHLEPFATGIEAMHKYGMNILIEKRLGVDADGKSCSFYSDSCFWNGKVDVAILNPVTCVIFDWKTGKPREDPFELRVQAVLLRAYFPTLEVFKGRYVWLKNNEMGESHELSDTTRTWSEMKSIAALIDRHQQMNHWPEQEGPLCAWCPVGGCQYNRNVAFAAAK